MKSHSSGRGWDDNYGQKHSLNDETKACLDNDNKKGG